MTFITALIGIVLTSSIYLSLQDGALTDLTSNQAFFLVAIGASIASAFIYFIFLNYAIQKRRLFEIVSTFSIAFSAYSFILLYLEVRFNTKDFVVALSLIASIVLLLFFSRLLISRIALFLALIAAVILGFATSGLTVDSAHNDLDRSVIEKYVFSSLHDIRVQTVSLPRTETQDGGAIASVAGSDLFLITGDGEIVKFDLSEGTSPTTLSKIEFGLSEYRNSARSPNRWYRITDALMNQNNSELLVTYTKWHKDEDCFTLNLDAYSISAENPSLSDQPIKIFESSPCIPHEVLSNETGGRILRQNESSIIFSVGSFKADKRLGLEDYYRSSYGKVMEYNRSTGELTTFTRGHRNAQGLEKCAGNIYLTEHGPYGGDELNLLKKGLDYGWPESSFGTDYGKKILTISGETGQHAIGQKPIYAWTPSIGISNLICLKGRAFENWSGDLLIASLNGLGAGYSVYRTRLTEGRAVSIERIELGFKVRDLTELDDGRILIWDGLNKISILSPAKTEFDSCSGCHNIRYRSHGIGPDLHGVVNAPIARHQDRYNYSEALKSLSGEWTPKRLHSFLENPQKFAPGTTMDIKGIKDYEKRQKIIDYLDGVSSNR